MSKYLPIIGLEIHAELNTKTKMFCDSKNDAAEIRPNINVCPVCLAHPGTLPVINKAAVEHVLRVGTALGSKLADYTEFDRKNYFYPDLPKGYQISQFEYPLVSGGMLAGVQLTRIHLEEDTASSIHDEKSGATLVDYNRAGVPLMELVTEPVIHSAEDAGNFGRELQLLLRYLGASEADMEKGQMRLEANISVAKISDEEYAKLLASGNTAAINAVISLGADKSVVATDAASNNSNASSGASSNTAVSSNSAAASDSISESKNSLGETHAELNRQQAEKNSTRSNASIAASVANADSSNTKNTSVPDSSKTDAAGAGERASNTKSGVNIAAGNTSLSKTTVASANTSVNTTGGAANSFSSVPAAQIVMLGTKVEVKNINSFRAMERAVQFEVKRQIALIEKAEKVVQETRGWDENKQATFSQRIKEGSADYRYFPDPDLPSLKLSQLNLTTDTIVPTLPELPSQRRERYKVFGISTQDVELYVKDDLFGGFFEAVEKELSAKAADVKLASNYIANDLVSLSSSSAKATEDKTYAAKAMKGGRDTVARDTKNLDKLGISPENFAKIIRMISAKKISSRSAKELLSICLDGISDPEIVAKEKNLLQESAAAEVVPVVAKIIADNSGVAAEFKAGKAAALEFLVGQGMKALRGSADPVVLRDEIKKQLM